MSPWQRGQAGGRQPGHELQQLLAGASSAWEAPRPLRQRGWAPMPRPLLQAAPAALPTSPDSQAAAPISGAAQRRIRLLPARTAGTWLPGPPAAAGPPPAGQGTAHSCAAQSAASACRLAGADGEQAGRIGGGWSALAGVPTPLPSSHASHAVPRHRLRMAPASRTAPATNPTKPAPVPPPNWARAALTARSMAAVRSALTWRTASGADAASSSLLLPPSSRQRCSTGRGARLQHEWVASSGGCPWAEHAGSAACRGWM